MGLLDDFFALNYDVRQQRDIERLQADLASVPDHRRVIAELLTITTAMGERIDRLELLNRALLEVVVSKQLTSAEEIDVLMQQVDLLDGVEDGKMSTTVREHAPKCRACHRHVNPRRESCVYCGHAIGPDVRQVPEAVARPIPKVSCTHCASVVPQNSTYYVAQGLVCEVCFVELGG